MSSLGPVAEQVLAAQRARGEDADHAADRLQCHLEDLAVLERLLPQLVAQAQASTDEPPLREQLLREILDLARACAFDSASCHVLDWQLLAHDGRPSLGNVIAEARATA